MIVSAEPIPAAEGAAVGLVDRLVSEEALVAAAIAYAGSEAIAGGPRPVGARRGGRAGHRGFQVAGCASEEMDIGPVCAVPKLLERAGLKVADIDLSEIDEAFASRALYCCDKLGIDPAQLNGRWRRDRPARRPAARCPARRRLDVHRRRHGCRRAVRDRLNRKGLSPFRSDDPSILEPNMPLRFAQRAEEAYAFPLTIGHLLDSVMTTAGQQEIVYRDRVRMTYQQFRQRIGRLASMLTGLGVDQGTVVAVLDWDSHRYLECYFAVPMMGAVLQTVNVRLPPAQVAYTIAHAGAEIVLVHRDFLPLLDAILPSLPQLRTLVVIADGEGTAIPTTAAGEYESLLAGADPGFRFTDFDENALATTFYTSGTTGQPKAVCFSHRQIVLHTIANIGPFGVTRDRGFGCDDVYMPLTPMFHVHAWGVPYMATVLGVKQVYPGRYEPDALLDLRRREGVTFSHCVPTIMQMLLAAADRRDEDLSGWLLTIGGAALTTSLCAEGRRRGMDIVAGYGMSETAPSISLARRRGDARSEEATVAALSMTGTPVPLVSARIVDDAMCELPRDGRCCGELVLRAPWLTPCYVGNEPASRELWRGGWLHTQDVATIDEAGNIRILDRRKDVIKSGGEWLCSISLEEVIDELDEVADVAVVAVADAQWGERPMAVIVPAAGATVTLELVNRSLERRIASGELSRYARLQRIELVEALPKTSVGKIDKKLLRASYASRQAPSDEAAAMPVAPA